MSIVESAGARVSRSVAATISDYLSLLNLRIVALLVLTAVAVMPAAGHTWPSPLAVLGVILGGGMAAAGAEAVNRWFERDLDAVMSRTRQRAVPAGRIPASHALGLGVGLNVVAVVVLVVTTNWVAAALSLAGALIYVFVYTIWLKRISPQNIVIGGAAGAIPPLVGWAAVTGGVDLTALAFFLVIFFWTPPHFWALAMLRPDDYAAAGVPMMNLVRGERSTRVQSFVYALLCGLVSLVPFFTHRLGWLYLLGAGGLGAGFALVAWYDLTRSGWTRRLFRASLAYMAAIFILVALTAVLP